MTTTFSNRISMSSGSRTPHAGGHRPFTIAVMSGKGGVGKTSVSANLGAALSRAGHRTLLVDADLGLANLDIVLGVEPQHTLADVLAGTATIEEVLVDAPGNLTLLPASSGVHELSHLDDGQRATLLAAIQSVEHRFDFVIIDCPAGIGRDVQLFGGVVDEVVLVATSDPTSLTDAYAVMKVLHSERARQSFSVIASMVTDDLQARRIYKVLSSVSDRLLNVRVGLMGWLEKDPVWQRAVIERRLAFTSKATSNASKQISNIATRIAKLASERRPRSTMGAVLMGGIA